MDRVCRSVLVTVNSLVQMASNRAIILKGQTATGKSDLALWIAERFPVAIISVDSAQVFRGLDIGTAKPGADVRRCHPHALVDIREPAGNYSAGDFRTDALTAMRAAARAGKTPLLVGGTLLYFRVLQRGLSGLPAGAPSLRRSLPQRAREAGYDTLHDWLKAIDAEAAGRIAPGDWQRIERALEVFLLTGRTLSQAWSRDPPAAGDDWRFSGLILVESDRDLLARRIEERVGRMLAEGLVAEVTELLEQNAALRSAPALRAVGYRQVVQYLEGEFRLPDLPGRISAATRQFAKRQMTWLRGEPHGVWLDGAAARCDRRIAEALLTDFFDGPCRARRAATSERQL